MFMLRKAFPTEGGAPDQADAGLVGLFIHKNPRENPEYEVFLIENVARERCFTAKRKRHAKQTPKLKENTKAS